MPSILATVPDDVFHEIPMYRAYLRVEGTLHAGYIYSNTPLTLLIDACSPLPFAWSAPIQARPAPAPRPGWAAPSWRDAASRCRKLRQRRVCRRLPPPLPLTASATAASTPRPPPRPPQIVGVAVQSWCNSALVSRALQAKAAALGAQGWGATRVRAFYGVLSAVLGGPVSEALPDCSIAHACAFQVFLCLLFGCVLPLGFTYVSERRAKRALLAATVGGGARGNGQAARLLHGPWAPVVAWAALAALWRVAVLYTLAQGDTVACPPGYL